MTRYGAERWPKIIEWLFGTTPKQARPFASSARDDDEATAYLDQLLGKEVRRIMALSARNVAAQWLDNYGGGVDVLSVDVMRLRMIECAYQAQQRTLRSMARVAR